VTCTKRVREALQKLDGVAAVDVNFAAKTATVTMKDDKTIQQKPIEDALKKAGYGVTRFETVAAKP
jgi:copper chaperone CopZ